MRKEDWIPVLQLPMEMIYRGEGTGVSHHVLVTDGKNGTTWVAFYSFSDGEWNLAHGTYSEDMLNRKITHWMPLPEKP